MNEITKPLLQATLDKYPELSEQIWAKVHYMVSDQCVGKSVVRHSPLVINDSDTCTGKEIGLRSFGNRRLRKSTQFVLKQFNQGLTIERDREGNIYCRKNSDSSSCHLEVVGWQTPQLQSLSPDIVLAKGRIPTDAIKVFDMCEYKSHVALELQNQKVNQEKLHQLSVFSISIIPESPPPPPPPPPAAAAAAATTTTTTDLTNADDKVPSNWLCIINLSAIDVLTNQKVIADIKAMQHLDLIGLEDVQLRRNWSRHELQKRPDFQETEEDCKDGKKAARRKQQEHRKSKKNVSGQTRYSWVEEEERNESQRNGSQPIRRLFSTHSNKEFSAQRKEWSALIGL